MFGSIIDKLKPVSYKWKSNDETESLKNTNITPGKKSFGFIAQDLLEIFPKEEYDIVKEDESGNLTVQYYQLIPLLVKEVKDLRSRVQELEDRIDDHEWFDGRW